MTERYKRILCVALSVVCGPENTITFVRQRHGPFAGNWLLPGGGIEVGEDPELAAIREVREEAGLQISSSELFALYELIGLWKHGVYHILIFAFRSRTVARVSPEFTGHNVEAVCQVPIGSVPLHSTDLKILTDAGVASFSNEEIDSALARDQITMRTYRTM
jgi:8-oxo-dGTP diphosphatase